MEIKTRIVLYNIYLYNFNKAIRLKYSILLINSLKLFLYKCLLGNVYEIQFLFERLHYH